MNDNFADKFLKRAINKREQDIRILNSLMEDIVRDREEIRGEIRELWEILGGEE